VRVRKNMFAGLPFKGDHDPNHRYGDLLNARRDRGSSDVMGALAKCPILIFMTTSNQNASIGPALDELQGRLLR
jgi:hypothetical protein